MLVQALRVLPPYFHRLMHDATSLGPNHLLGLESVLLEVRFAVLALVRVVQKRVPQVLVAPVQVAVLVQRVQVQLQRVLEGPAERALVVVLAEGLVQLAQELVQVLVQQALALLRRALPRQVLTMLMLLALALLLSEVQMKPDGHVVY